MIATQLTPEAVLMMSLTLTMISMGGTTLFVVCGFVRIQERIERLTKMVCYLSKKAGLCDVTEQTEKHNS
jgi:hypothetical protein